MSHPPSKPVAYFCLGLSMTMVGCYVALTKPLVAAIRANPDGYRNAGIVGAPAAAIQAPGKP